MRTANRPRPPLPDLCGPTPQEDRMSTCVLPHRHDPDRPRRALDGMLVCAGCLHRVEQAIAELPGQHDALERRLAPGAGSGRGAPGASSWALPIVPVIADHREDI